MRESIVVVGAALSADVDAPTERVHSAPGARRGQSPAQTPESTLPIELKRELYDTLSADIARQLKRRHVSAEDVLEDFEAFRTKRRATRRRR
jgi:hypothetical protein